MESNLNFLKPNHSIFLLQIVLSFIVTVPHPQHTCIHTDLLKFIFYVSVRASSIPTPQLAAISHWYI